MGVFGTNPAQAAAGLGNAQRAAGQESLRRKATQQSSRREVERAHDSVELSDAVHKPDPDSRDAPAKDDSQREAEPGAQRSKSGPQSAPKPLDLQG